MILLARALGMIPPLTVDPTTGDRKPGKGHAILKNIWAHAVEEPEHGVISVLNTWQWPISDGQDLALAPYTCADGLERNIVIGASAI